MRLENSKLHYKDGESNAEGTLFETIDFRRDGKCVANFKVGRFTLEQGAVSRQDQHEVRECWIVAVGEGLLFHNENEVKIKAGDYLFFDSMETHQVKNTGDDQLVIYSTWWDV